MSGYSPKLPLQYSTDDGYYAMNKTMRDTIRQNFRMLLQTCPGERIMLPDFGVGLRNFLFEHFPEDQITSKIHEQVGKYMKFIKIKKISFRKNENYLYCQIAYEIPSLSLEDTLSTQTALVSN
jgi:phage baseplate assembly protein W